jgi:hypothetical protein
MTVGYEMESPEITSFDFPPGMNQKAQKVKKKKNTNRKERKYF